MRHIWEAKALADLIMCCDAGVGADSLMSNTLSASTLAIYNHLTEIEKVVSLQPNSQRPTPSDRSEV